MLQGSALVRATLPFSKEQAWRSWMNFLVTGGLWAGALALAVALPHWWGQLGASVLAGLLMCRMFIVYHDHQHGSILRDSKLADLLMHGLGLLMMSPSSTWKASHNHHHRNNMKLHFASEGSFPILTVEEYAAAPWYKKLRYRVSRHPLTIFAAIFTVFTFRITICSLARDPRKHWDCALALVLHAAIWTLLAIYAPAALLFGVFIPTTVGSMLGAYLFYAQHTFPGVDLTEPQEWDYHFAALKSSSFMDLSPMMHWFTGNIGYHHIHHLNHNIPFYRLPEVMASLPELQQPGRTTLRVADIVACLRLKLWDDKARQMVTYGQARQMARTAMPAAA